MENEYRFELTSNDPTCINLRVYFPEITPKQLFDAFTIPEQLTAWWSQKALIEPVVGGRYRLSWQDMEWHLYGKYLHFEAPVKLIFSWRWEHEPEGRGKMVELDFLAGVAGTTLQLKHVPYAPSKHEQEERQSHLDGWKYFFEKLNQYLHP